MLGPTVVTLLLALDRSAAWSSCRGVGGSTWSSRPSSSLYYDARALLYEDHRAAQERRAYVEEDLMRDNTKELKAPKLRAKPAKSGRGFGAGSGDSCSPLERLAIEQAKVVRKEGLIRIDGALSPSLADNLRAHVLKQQALANEETDRNPGTSQDYFGVENQRKNRCDLQLSLSQQDYYDANSNAPPENVLAATLQELLGTEGSLRHLYEQLVTPQGEFYELATVITDPGSDRQQVHPDLPFQSNAPLYVVFLALQDVTEEMGPTTFLPGTHTSKACNIFSGKGSAYDDLLSSTPCFLATLKKGDAVVFDARVFHCGNANDAEKGSTRAMFNFSFRNPKTPGKLGYCGSMRPGYSGRMVLADVTDALEAYESGDMDPFARYGDGL